MTPEQWKTKLNQKVKLHYRYIFVYSMEDSENIMHTVKQIQIHTKLPVIAVIGGGTGKIFDAKISFDCGPAEFLSYINNAEFVITNSFHGVAISILLEKKIYCVAHTTRNTRLENIMKLSGNENNIISSTNIQSYDDYEINGKLSYEKLKDMISFSQGWITEQIYRNENFVN